MVLFSFSQDDGCGTDFLKNAITYGQSEGLGNDLWRVEDVSCRFFFHCPVMTSCLIYFSLCELGLGDVENQSITRFIWEQIPQYCDNMIVIYAILRYAKSKIGIVVEPHYMISSM